VNRLAPIVLVSALSAACGSAQPKPTVTVASTAPAAPSSTPSAPGPKAQEPAITLVSSTTASAPTKHLTTIVMTRHEIRLLGDAAFSMPTPGPAAWDRGMPESVKRSGPNDLFLVPLAGWLANVHDTHDVSVIVDAAIPYRLLMEVLFTCAQSNLDTFHLVVLHDRQPAEIVVRAPHVDSRTLSLPALTLLVVGEGVSVKSAGANVAPGCRGAGPGIAVPHVDGSVDEAGLRACIQSIGGTAPAPIQASMVAANPSTPFGEVVATLDALRASGVTDVSFGLAR
jgi:biopolymer transport protein ExbD